jgi:4-hydroxybenzoate polyprenyltransferase
MWVLLIAVGFAVNATYPYYIAVAIMGGILFYEHRIVKADNLARVNEAFFNANSWLALTMLTGVIIDVWIR